MKTCRQSDHKWIQLNELLPLYRYKCTICEAIGKIYPRKKGRNKIIPLKNEETKNN